MDAHPDELPAMLDRLRADVATAQAARFALVSSGLAVACEKCGTVCAFDPDAMNPIAGIDKVQAAELHIWQCGHCLAWNEDDWLKEISPYTDHAVTERLIRYAAAG